MILHATPEAPLQHVHKIESEAHWHGGKGNALLAWTSTGPGECWPSLVLLEVMLSCHCQKELERRGVMEPVKEQDGVLTMRWHGLLKESMSFKNLCPSRTVRDAWTRMDDAEQVQVKVKKEYNGGMPAPPLAEVPEMEGLEDPRNCPAEGLLYGILLRPFRNNLMSDAGLSWMMQPGGWGSFTMYQWDEFWRSKKKYYDYEEYARTPSDFKQALCRITISVKSERAWQWLKDYNVLVPHYGGKSTGFGTATKWRWKAPIHGVEYWETPNGEIEICYQATVSDMVMM